MIGQDKMKLRTNPVRWLRTLSACALGLAIVTGWRLTSPWRDSSPGWHLSSALARDVQFDCFSRPSIAFAILHREAERSFAASVQLIDFELAAQDSFSSIPSHTGLDNGIDAVHRNDAFERSRNGSVRVAAALKEIEELRSRAAGLKDDLDRKLMVLYSRNALSNQFLDCYLNLLPHAPDGEIVLWARSALECSLRCGREEEVMDAM